MHHHRSNCLFEDNMRAMVVQDYNSLEYTDRLKELEDFYQNQCWRHMYTVLKFQGITFQELCHRGREAAIDFLEAEGFTREEASSELGHQGYGGSIGSIVAEGFTEEEVLSKFVR